MLARHGKFMNAVSGGDLKTTNALLSKGVSVDMLYYDETALMVASCKGHTAIAKRLLAAGANPDRANSVHDASLLIASRNGYIDIVNALLDAGANVKHVGEYGYTALALAIRRGHGDIAIALIAAGANDGPALVALAVHGRLGEVESLLNNGADVDVIYKGVSALMGACDAGHVEIVKTLIANGADVNKKDLICSSTALMCASFKGHVDIVHMLLDAGADINTVNNDGSTALMLAVDHNKLAVVCMLLRRGASVDAVDENGFNALSISTNCKRPHEEVRVRELITRELLNHGETAVRKNGKKSTPAAVSKSKKPAKSTAAGSDRGPTKAARKAADAVNERAEAQAKAAKARAADAADRKTVLDWAKKTGKAVFTNGSSLVELVAAVAKAGLANDSAEKTAEAATATPNRSARRRAQRRARNHANREAAAESTANSEIARRNLEAQDAQAKAEAKAKADAERARRITAHEAREAAEAAEKAEKEKRRREANAAARAQRKAPKSKPPSQSGPSHTQPKPKERRARSIESELVRAAYGDPVEKAARAASGEQRKEDMHAEAVARREAAARAAEKAERNRPTARDIIDHLPPPMPTIDELFEHEEERDAHAPRTNALGATGRTDDDDGTSVVSIATKDVPVKATKHAEDRRRQRKLTTYAVQHAVKHGETSAGSRPGTYKVSDGRTTAVLSADGTCITAYADDKN
jgi:ankyrin repeat protein